MLRSILQRGNWIKPVQDLMGYGGYIVNRRRVATEYYLSLNRLSKKIATIVG